MGRSKMLQVRERAEKDRFVMLYLRVSTDRQAEEGYSIAIQKERLTAYAHSLFGSENVKLEYFIDDGYSGGNLERPEMQRMIGLIRSGVGSHVVVYKLDRLSRSQKDTLYLIEDVFLAHDVAFVSMLESFNTATPFGRAVVGILSVFAQLERENIFERTRSGMQKRVESGLWMGGGRVPFGYDYDREQGILVPNRDADTVRAVYDLYIQGYALQHIANLLGLKYERLAAQILTRKSNAGVIVYNGKEYPGRHEPIVSMETYETAMRLLRERSAKRMVTKTDHLLTGLVRCGVCGAKMRYIKWGKDSSRLMCYSREKSKPYLVRDPNCDNEPADADAIERIVTEDLFAMTRQAVPDPENETVEVLQVLRERLAACTHKLKRLYNLYSAGEDEILVESIGEIKREMAGLQEQIRAEEERGAVSREARRTRESLGNLAGAWPWMTLQERRAAIRSVVECVVVTHNRVHIQYKL